MGKLRIFLKNYNIPDFEKSSSPFLSYLASCTCLDFIFGTCRAQRLDGIDVKGGAPIFWKLHGRIEF
jgi:hypothetical protein